MLKINEESERWKDKRKELDMWRLSRWGAGVQEIG